VLAELAVAVSRIALGVAMAAAGISKVADLEAFESAARALLGNRARLAHAARYAVPTLELGSGLSLVLGVGTKAVSLLVAGMLAVFTLVLVVNLVRGNRPRCGCFGSIGSAKIGASSIYRNLAMLAAAGVVYFAGPGALSLETRL